MNNITEENINTFNNGVRAFFDKIDIETKLLQEDLKAIDPPSSNGKICDYGCGFGFTTYCLMSILNATEGIGVDVDPPAISQAALWFKAVKLHLQSKTEKTLSERMITEQTNHLLGILRPPEFTVGDVILGENLPSDVNLAYCRRLLVNIVQGKYHDNLSGKDRAKLAIKNIVKTKISGGWFIAVEEASGGNFCRLLEEENLYCVNTVRFQLSGVIPYFRYVYRKPHVL